MHALQVVSLVEMHKSCLPELFCVHRRPGKLTFLDLFLPAFKCAELMVVLVKVSEQFFKHCADVFVNPGTVLKLHNNFKTIDHGEALHAVVVSFKVQEKHADDTHNFLFVKEIENFGYVFNNVH